MAYAETSEVGFATESELQKIEEIRSKLEPELTALRDAGKDFPHTTGDIFFTRLLRGNSQDVEESVKWYKSFVALRAKWGLDEIHLECEKNGIAWEASQMPHYNEIKKFINTTFDENSLRSVSGSPIWYDAMGDARPQQLMDEVPIEKINKFFHTMYERRTSTLDKMSREQGQIVKILRIVDVEAMTMSNAMNRKWKKHDKEAIEPVLMGTSIETVQNVFVTNFPRKWLKAWDIFKVFLPKRLLKRFRLLGDDYATNKEYMAEVTNSMTTKLVETNKSHNPEGKVTGASDNYEGTDLKIPAGLSAERIMEVTPGQKITWNYTVGKADSSKEGGGGGFFSRMATKFSGSEVVFNVSALWTDVAPADVTTIPAKVRSAGEETGDAAEFWLEGSKIEYEASTGVNIVAVNMTDKSVISSKAYLPGKDGVNDELIKDLAEIPKNSMILFGVKGTGAEDLSEDAWAALEECGAGLKQGHWHKGYAFIGVKGGVAVSEARGPDVVAEGDVPTTVIEEDLVKSKEVSVDDGVQEDSLTFDRAGMVVIGWSNTHSYMATKSIASFKLTLE